MGVDPFPESRRLVVAADSGYQCNVLVSKSNVLQFETTSMLVPCVAVSAIVMTGLGGKDNRKSAKACSVFASRHVEVAQVSTATIGPMSVMPRVLAVSPVPTRIHWFWPEKRKHDKWAPNFCRRRLSRPGGKNAGPQSTLAGDFQETRGALADQAAGVRGAG